MKWPATAVAAATAGETRWVRPPRPWRPSKLRLLVLAARSPGASLSGFIARHIEQPGSRQSAPAAVKTRSRPSASAWAFTAWLPGTTITRLAVTWRPSSTAAAARRSSMRLFVHEPMNTVSTAMSRSGVPAVRPMYSSARPTVSRVGGVGEVVGRRHGAVDRRDLARVRAPRDLRAQRRGVDVHLRSHTASSSLRSVRQSATRLLPRLALRGVVAAREVGERRLVGRDQPGLGAGLDRHVADRHPALHRERPDRRAAVLDDVADAAAGADLADHGEDDVLGRDAGGQLAVDVDGHPLRAGVWGSVWVASTCSTSLVPMPNASAPNAPCVAVWLSPQTIVMPGSVRPCSGPMTWTMPWPGSPIGKLVMPNSAVFSRSTSTWRAEIGSAIGWSMSAVGTLWSSVAMVSSGRRTRAARQAQAVERLRAGDLVDEVEVDVEQVGLARRRAHDVALPHLLRQGLRC